MTVPAGGRARPENGRRPPPPPGPGPRPPQPDRSRLTSRAAVLAVVFCAIALSLAYPVREYIAQRRQIDQLEAQRQEIGVKLGQLEQEQQQLTSSAYVEQQAQDKLHMCLPTKKCYVIINQPQPRVKTAPGHAPAAPWYARLWTSVRQADKAPSR